MSTLKGLPDSPCSYLLGHQDSAMMYSLALVFLIEELMTFRHLHLCKWKIGSPELCKIDKNEPVFLLELGMQKGKYFLQPCYQHPYTPFPSSYGIGSNNNKKFFSTLQRI